MIGGIVSFLDNIGLLQALQSLDVAAASNIVLPADVVTSGDQTYLYGTTGAGVNSRVILNDTTLHSTAGDIFIGANRIALEASNTAFIGDDLTATGTTADATIYNAGTGDVTILADAGSIEFSTYEKLTVGNDLAPGNLTLTSANTITVGDVTVIGDLAINANELVVQERVVGAARLNDNLPAGSTIQEDKGADIVVKGILDLTANTVRGSNNSATQNQIGIGAGTVNIAVPNIGAGVIVGGQASDEIFASSELSTPQFDFIATPANATFPYVEDLSNIDIVLAEEEASDAVRAQLLNLRIFARDLTQDENRMRRALGHLIVSTIVVDEAAPISDYEVAINRISPAAAEKAIEQATLVFGEAGDGLDPIGEALGQAYAAFMDRNPDASAKDFANYLSSSEQAQAVDARAALAPLVQLFESISTIGVTPAELAISRESVISRLRVDGLRGRELFEFFDAYAPARLQLTAR
jgi:hypothetical protein